MNTLTITVSLARLSISPQSQSTPRNEPLPRNHRVFFRPFLPRDSATTGQFIRVHGQTYITLIYSLNVADYSFFSDFVAYQYYLHVVPTTYIASRSSPLHTAQYSVAHYTREVSEGGTPGIFFKFDLDPLALSIHQRTTTFLQLLIRCVGVLGGAFVCMGYAIRVTNRAVEVVVGPSEGSGGIVAAESTGVRTGLRAKWAGAELRSRAGKSPRMVPQGSGWTVDSPGSPYSTYTGTPVSATYSPSVTNSPYLASPNAASVPPYSPTPYSPTPYSPNPGASGGFRSTSATLAPPRSGNAASFGLRSASAGPTTFPLSPLASSNFPASPLPTAATFGSSGHDDTGSLPPPSANLNGHRSPGPDYANGADGQEPPPTPGVGYAAFPPSSPNPMRVGPVPGGRVPGPVGAKKDD